MKKKLSFLSQVMFVVALLSTSTSFAVKEYVQNTNDTGAGSLRDIIDNSNNGDTIVINVVGTLTVNSPIGVNTDVTIIGPGPIHFKIDFSPLSGAGPAAITPGGSATIHIEGIGFINGTNGHAINAGSGYTGTTTVYGCSFENCEQTAVNVDGGDINFETCSFVNVGYSFGHVAFVEANSKFVNCTFYNNANGAVWVNNGTTEILHCTFFENGGSTASSNAITVMNGALTIKNNIVFNDTQSDALIDLVGAGTITSQGGNVTNDMSTAGMPTGTDILSVSVDAGISAGTMIVDGWGITYFPLRADTVDAVDIDQTIVGLPEFDARRVWRTMDAGTGNLYADAGAVEYTPLRVRSAGYGSFNQLDYAVNNIYPSLTGNTAFVFEIPGVGPHTCPAGSWWLAINKNSTIINGFSQNGSKVPGPGTTPSSVTPAITSIVIDNTGGSNTSLLEITGNDVVLAGLCVSGNDDSFDHKGVRTYGFGTEISGCHIGVDPTGVNTFANTVGILVYNGSAKIGSGHYCGKSHHNNRNVVAGNRHAQISLVTMESCTVKGNFIGVASNGLNLPTAALTSQDTGIYVYSFSASPGSLIGGDESWEGNVIADQNFGILIESENNKIFSNKIGVDYSGNGSLTGATNVNGIYVTSGFSNNNKIGKAGSGNIIGNHDTGIYLTNSSYHSMVRSNIIGVGSDTLSNMGNQFDGVYVTNSSSFNMIGGCNPGDGNIIGFNDVGITFEGGGADNDTVRGNFIGINPLSANIGNGFAGMTFIGAVSNISVGDIGMGCANEIAFNGVGLATDGVGNFDVHISGNSFHDNVGIGIDLDDDGQNATGASGAAFDNDNAETPALISAVDCGGTVNLGIQLDVTEDVVIEVFKAADSQEGDSLITQQTVTFTAGVTTYVPFGSLPAGTDVVVTATYDGGGGFKNTSEFSSPISITVGTPPTVNIVGQDSICDGDAGVFSTTTVTGATYNWYLYNGFDPFQTASVTDSNAVVIATAAEPTYSTDSLIVEVDDAGCVMRDTITLYHLFAPYVDMDSVVQVTTCGGTGELYFATYEQNSPLTIYYNGGTAYNATTDGSSNGWFPMTGLPEGTYNIDSISNGICADPIGGIYTLTDPTPPSASAGVDQNSCEGSPVTLSGTAGGGSGTYTYAWDNGGGAGQTVSVSPVVDTDYALTVTDVETLCEASDTMTVTVTPLPTVSADLDQTSCADAPTITLNGSVTNATGGIWTSSGTGTFTPGSTTLNADYVPSAGDVSSGSVILTLTTSGTGVCPSTSDDMILTINPVPNVANPAITDVSCFGGADGSITLLPSGSYSYAWTGPSSYTSSMQDITGLEAGTYSLTMTDGAGCTGTYSGTVNQPVSLPSFTTTQTDVTCNGGTDGSFTVTPAGGTGPYEISIDGGSTYTSPNFGASTWSGYPAMSFNVIIRDANGCLSTSGVVTLNEPSALTFTLVKLDDTCSLAKGEIQFVPAGGTSPYQYSIDAGATYQTTDTYSGLLNGGYSLEVQDANGCVTSTFTTLNDQSGVSVVVNAYSSQVSCFDSFDGYIDVLTTDPFGGGVNYSWTYNTSPFATTEDLSSLYGGDYELIATDIGGCKDTLPVTIATPPQLFMSVVVTDETCSGYADGQLDTTGVFGGTLPVSLDWIALPGNTNIGSTAPLTGVSTGDYVGVITDAFGCTASDTVTVSAGESYTPAISMFYTDSCINNNSFDFVDGGSGPSSGAASYSWTFTNGTPMTSTIPNPTGVVFNWVSLQAVMLDVTSNSGCVFKDTVYADIYDTATVALTPMDISCFGANDGSVTASATGGFGPYQYSFNGGVPAAVNSISGLGAGTVTCYVVDVASGCQSSVHSVGVAEPSQITFTATISDATCGDSNGQVIFQNVTGGTGTYTYSVDGSNYVTGSTIPNLAPGPYDFYVQDGNGCVETQNTNTVGNVGNPVPTPTIVEGSPVVLCADGSGFYGYLTSQSNDVSPGSFEWSINSGGSLTVVSANDSLQLDDFNTSGGYVYLSESNGTCTSDLDSVMIDFTANDAVDNTITEICLGDAANLDITTSGTVTWIDGGTDIADTSAAQTTATPAVLPFQYTYEVLIGDCIFTDTVVLTLDPDCDGITVVNNAFSPNGDGVNDYFIIDANALLSNTNTVTIINRWGDIINEYENYDNLTIAWDGTNKSQEPVPSGTYFFVVEIPDIGFKTTGWIQVVR